MRTSVRGLAVPERVSREAYGAINGALVAPMNVMQAIAPLISAWIWSATGGYDAVLVAIGAGPVSLCIRFWTAAVLSRRSGCHELFMGRPPLPQGYGQHPETRGGTIRAEHGAIKPDNN